MNASAASPVTACGRIVVAMSGGVDSSVAALLLKEQGYSLLGVSMQVWDYRSHGGSRSRATCCAPSDFEDARRVAAQIGIPYYVFDFENIFREQVINTFVTSYQQGMTPNPCIDCNNKVKFRELRDRAKALGAGAVATGHYAVIEKHADGFHLKRGADPEKDQSYFLYGITPEELATTLFPVGNLTKQQVREHARRFGLATAEKAESQDICFVSGKVEEFVARLGGRCPPGEIVDRAGNVLGVHQGLHAFTVGQRRGLRIGGAEEPWYVVELDPQQNRVIVGKREDLAREGFEVHTVSWCAPQIRERLANGEPFELQCLAQVRYRHRGVPVEMKISPSAPDRVQLRFTESWAAISPGQAAVFYDLASQEVLGGGRIAGGAALVERPIAVSRRPRAAEFSVLQE